MDRRQVLIAMLAIAAGCAAVVAVGMHQRAARRAAWMAQIRADDKESEDVGQPRTASAQAPARAEAGGDGAAADHGAVEPVAGDGEATLAAAAADAADPPRAYHPHKKKSKPKFDRDARRLSDSPGPRRQPTAAAQGATDPAAARLALSLVGIDPDAEAVWAGAINDPSRTAHERQDLIEDLNEDGFPDPKHVTADDLPLIESRLALIEQFAPEAMDDVNAAAFAEAYKDLMNMYGRAVSGADEP
jgi:hypothetical protein